MKKKVPPHRMAYYYIYIYNLQHLTMTCLVEVECDVVPKAKHARTTRACAKLSSKKVIPKSFQRHLDACAKKYNYDSNGLVVSTR